MAHLTLVAHLKRSSNDMAPEDSSQALVIDRYVPIDSVAVIGLLQQLWPGKNLDSAVIHGLLNDALRCEARVLLCARLESKIVGFGSMTVKSMLWHEGNIGWIDELVVDSSYRGRGVGKTVLGHLVSLAKERGCKAIELDSAFHRKDSHLFYEAVGFESRAFLFSMKI